MRRVVLLALAACVPVLARADEVYTRSGGRLSGEIVERRAHSLVLDIGIGRVELPLSYIDRVVPGESPLTVYRQRARALATDDVDGWLELGHWAAGNELETQAAEAFKKVVSVDPGHADAQQALGRVNVAGAWMTPEESYEARGLVRFNGVWVSPEERDHSLAERDDAERRAREEANEQARLRETEARLRAAEAEARIAEARAREVEAHARAAEIQAASFLPVVPAIIVAPPYFPAYDIEPALPPMAVSIGAASRRVREAADRARAIRTAARNEDASDPAGTNPHSARRAHRRAGSSK